MLNLLEKFENIEVKNTNRISEEDQQFCEKQERFYNNLVEVYKDFQDKLQSIREESEVFGKEYGETINKYFYPQQTALYYSWSNRDIEDNINKMKDKFISLVSHYFMKKYTITIDYEKIQKKYKGTFEITHDDILNEIFEQLGGFSFNEKADKEIIDSMKELTKQYREDSPKVKLAKNKLTINSFFYIDSWDAKYGNYRVNYHYNENFNTLLKVLTHFNGNNGNMFQSLGEIREISEYLIQGEKTQSVKLFKNGRIDILFKDAKTALEFRNKYCD